jgi:hypothetical protein
MQSDNSYFSSFRRARRDAAAMTLKEPGHTYGDAMGILVLNSPKAIEVDKVGARSTAAGAGIGACVPALAWSRSPRSRHWWPACTTKASSSLTRTRLLSSASSTVARRRSASSPSSARQGSRPGAADILRRHDLGS